MNGPPPAHFPPPCVADAAPLQKQAAPSYNFQFTAPSPAKAGSGHPAAYLLDSSSSEESEPSVRPLLDPTAEPQPTIFYTEQAPGDSASSPSSGPLHRSPRSLNISDDGPHRAASSPPLLPIPGAPQRGTGIKRPLDNDSRSGTPDLESLPGFDDPAPYLR